MEANERLYVHGVATCEWNGGDKGESGWYFEYILEALHTPQLTLLHVLIKSIALFNHDLLLNELGLYQLSLNFGFDNFISFCKVFLAIHWIATCLVGSCVTTKS